MALPKIDRPIFELTLPIINEKVKMRPYLVKEEKILLMAQQSQDVQQIILATKQVINNCIVEGDINVDKIPNFLIEWIILQLRIQSVGNIVELKYKDNEDDKSYEFQVDLNEVKVIEPENHTDAFEITPEIGVMMKYPTIEIFSGLDLEKDILDFGVEVIIHCIDKVFTEDEIINFHEHTIEEKVEFLDQFNRQELEQLVSFFETIPYVAYDITYTNSLGNERIIELRSLEDFF